MGCHRGTVTGVASLIIMMVGVKGGMSDMVVANGPDGSWIIGIMRNMGRITGIIPGKVSD